MKSFSYKIKDKTGIHARPAGLLCKLAKEFDCEITIEKDGKTVNVERLMQVMSMGIRCDDTVKISASGKDEDKAVKAVEDFFCKNL